MIYRVAYNDDVEGSEGFGYFGSFRAAQKEWSDYCKTTEDPHPSKFKQHETPKNKQEMIQLLNLWGGHNDNG